MPHSKDPSLVGPIVTPEVLTDDAGYLIPTEKDLPSRMDDLSWSDAGEFMAEAASAIPVAGSLIKRIVEFGGGLGSYSKEERLKTLQWRWLLTQIDKLQEKINILLKTLPEDQKPEPADVAAVITAIIQASEKTADYRKRRLLKNALVNSFDAEQYQAGLALRFIAFLEELQYGDVDVLGRISRAEEAVSNTNFQIKLEKENPYRPSISEREREQIAKAKLIFEEGDLTASSLFVHHLSILEKNGLVFVEDYSSMSHLPEPIRRILSWRDYLLQENLSSLSGGSYTRVPQVADIGKEFIRFVQEPDSDVQSSTPELR